MPVFKNNPFPGAGGGFSFLPPGGQQVGGPAFAAPPQSASDQLFNLLQGGSSADLTRQALGNVPRDFQLDTQLGEAGRFTASNLAGFGSVALPLGFSNLLEILQSQGRTDPALMNQQIAGISRGTQGAQDAARGSLARGNLQNSGVGAALEASIGQAGQDRIAGVRANEARLAEDRKRQDLGLLLDLIIGPGLGAAGVKSGVDQANQARAQQREAAYLNFAGNLVGGLPIEKIFGL